MARLVPPTIPSGASEGEKRLFQCLSRLPDDVLVCYEPRVRNRHPDFVVVLPKVGILVIEVKGWYAGNILKADADNVVYRRDGIEQNERHPLRQAREYMFRVMDSFRDHWTARELLLNQEGAHRGNVKYPFTCIAILSNATRHAVEHAVGNARSVFPHDRVVFRDEFLRWENLPPDTLHREFRRFFDPWWDFGEMTEPTLEAIQEVITGSRTIVDPIPPSPGQATGEDPPELKYLDKMQAAHAQAIGSGHRIVYGVPGSGKTVMLIARVHHHYAHRPYERVLVTCFNLCLATWLKQCLSDTPAEVVHFHRWAFHRERFDSAVDDNEYGERVLSSLGPSDRVYDAVLIDEAQDFAPSWFKCLLAVMKDPVNGDLFVVGDGGQGISNRGRRMVWKDVGIRAQGRSSRLTVNYRNTREIVELAEHFSAVNEGNPEEGLGAIRIDPAQTVRKGSRLYTVQCTDRHAELRAVEHLVRELLAGRWGELELSRPFAGAEIGILYPRASAEEKALLRTLEARLKAIPGSGGAIWIRKDAKGIDTRHLIAEPGIKLLTVESSRGLQFRTVILIFADKFDQQGPGQDRALAYVALTRPEDHMAVTFSRVTEPIRRIVAGTMAVVMPEKE